MRRPISKVADKLIQGIEKYFGEAGYNSGVVGLSGGVDSAVVYYLGIKALDTTHTHAILMPNGKHSSSESIEHAKLLLEKLDVPKIYDISPIVDSIVNTLANVEKQLKWQPSMNDSARDLDIRYGNIAARVRMVVLFDYAAKHRCLVMGTENKSEHYLGYFTLFGDSASCIEPIRELCKTEVYELARYLGVPEVIINKAPSADLWGGQTDEGELGFTYKDADYWIEQLENSGGNPKIEDEKYRKIDEHIKRVAFKNKLPYVVPLNYK